MDIIDRIMNRPEFAEHPPVLVEVGASGGTHAAWKRIAPWSVCIAFDPDSRDMHCVEEEKAGYRMLLIQPAAAVAEPVEEADFYLTRSPYCSSLLRPNATALADWDFARLFEIEKQARVRCVQLSAALHNLEIDRVDWFKADSQGTDLRLFQSLGDEVSRRVLAAEFEPGILDAYEGEDKLSSLLTAMDGPEFWVSDLRILGTLRIPAVHVEKWSERDRQVAAETLPRAPGWAEIAYLNTFRGEGPFDRREWLLGWVIAILKRQYGFALDLAERAEREFGDSLFGELKQESQQRIDNALRSGRLRLTITNWCRRVRDKLRRMVQAGRSTGRP